MRLQAIQEAIDYLVSDSPKKMNEVEVIRDIQYWDAYGKRFTGEVILGTDTVAMEAAMKHVEYLKNEWKPKYCGHRSRAGSIGSKSSVG